MTSSPELREAAVRRALNVGVRVLLQGLQSSPELNGLQGVVKSTYKIVPEVVSRPPMVVYREFLEDTDTVPPPHLQDSDIECAKYGMLIIRYATNQVDEWSMCLAHLWFSPLQVNYSCLQART